jgi:NTP pyrophosphatase (non-canonical NTP hydrolase)
MTIEEAQIKVDNWIKQYGVRYFDEMTNMALLVEEVGEVARIMARTYGEQSAKATDMSQNLSEELADVMWVLMCIANQTGINLTKAFEYTIEKKTQRDNKRHLDNPKLRK